MKNTDFDSKSYRRALSLFPTGVTIMTTTDQAENPVGMTASSFNSVSMDPPLILWSIDKRSSSLEDFRQAKGFAVNILTSEQTELSNRFARRGNDKFVGLPYSVDRYGNPLLQECASQMECQTWAVYEGGDHFIIVGKVIDYRYDSNQSPLVFSEGSYAVISQHS